METKNARRSKNDSVNNTPHPYIRKLQTTSYACALLIFANTTFMRTDPNLHAPVPLAQRIPRPDVCCQYSAESFKSGLGSSENAWTILPCPIVSLQLSSHVPPLIHEPAKYSRNPAELRTPNQPLTVSPFVPPRLRPEPDDPFPPELDVLPGVLPLRVLPVLRGRRP